MRPWFKAMVSLVIIFSCVNHSISLKKKTSVRRYGALNAKVIGELFPKFIKTVLKLFNINLLCRQMEMLRPVAGGHSITELERSQSR